MKARHGDPELLKWKCDHCGKRFVNKSGLDYHLLYHTGVKDWICETCGKCFVNKVHLNAHLITHTDERFV